MIFHLVYFFLFSLAITLSAMPSVNNDPMLIDKSELFKKIIKTYFSRIDIHKSLTVTHLESYSTEIIGPQQIINLKKLYPIIIDKQNLTGLEDDLTLVRLAFGSDDSCYEDQAKKVLIAATNRHSLSSYKYGQQLEGLINNAKWRVFCPEKKIEHLYISEIIGAICLERLCANKIHPVNDSNNKIIDIMTQMEVKNPLEKAGVLLKQNPQITTATDIEMPTNPEPLCWDKELIKQQMELMKQFSGKGTGDRTQYRLFAQFAKNKSSESETTGNTETQLPPGIVDDRSILGKIDKTDTNSPGRPATNQAEKTGSIESISSADRHSTTSLPIDEPEENKPEVEMMHPPRETRPNIFRRFSHYISKKIWRQQTP